MADQRLGEMLRSRRESLGLSISQAAQDTNIRPRVLETFEKEDYANFPPHGYSTGMLSSYARCLGLDPREVLQGYEDGLSSYNQKVQSEKDAAGMLAGAPRFGQRRSRKDQGASDPSMTGANPAITGAIDTAGDIARATSAIKVVSRGGENAAGRAGRAAAPNASSSYAGRNSRTSRARGATATRSSRTAADSALPASHTGRLSAVGTDSESPARSSRGRYASRLSSSPSDAPSRNYATGRLSALTEDIIPKETRTSSSRDEEPESTGYQVRGGKKYNPSSRVSSGRSSRRHREIAPTQNIFHRIIGSIAGIFSDKNSRLIAIAAILVVIALVIAGSILISSAGGKGKDILNVEGGAEGEAVTSAAETEDGRAAVTVTTSNGNPIVVSIDVEQGDTCLINVTYDDDQAYSGTAVGPWHREFQVTQSMTATFGTPGAVKVTQNGEEIEIPVGSDGSGTLELSVQASGLAAGGASRS